MINYLEKTGKTEEEAIAARSSNAQNPDSSALELSRRKYV